MASEYSRMIRKVNIMALLLAVSLFGQGCKGDGKDGEAVRTNTVPVNDGQGISREGIEDKPDENEDKYFDGEENIEADIENNMAEREVDEREVVESVQENEEQEENKPDRPKVKGIFVTGPMAGTSNMDNLIALVEETELNAMVIDIKNDEGRVTYDMQIPAVQEIGSGIRYVQDMEALITKCKEKNIYLIARIVAFKDPFLADVRPQWCIHNKDGSVFRDKGGLAWLNPYNREVWEYLLDIAEEALRMGFDEVQFDYIRFSTDSGMENVDFGQEGAEKDRQEIITEFAAFARERVHEAGGIVSADVYGMVIDSQVDQRIVGQNYLELSKELDYISPMVYPSHYGPYNYNIPIPDAEPYRLVLTALQSSRKVLAGVSPSGVSDNMEINSTEINSTEGNSVEEGFTEEDSIKEDSMEEGSTEEELSIEELSTEEKDFIEKEYSVEEHSTGKEYSAEELAALLPMDEVRAQVRPWLQDFTATWVKGHIPYGAEEIREQIQAVYDAGYEEWILWNASNRYTEDGLLRADE